MRAASDPLLRADDSAYGEGRGCYTTVRIAAGRARFLRRHVARLRRDARALEIGDLPEEAVRRAVEELAAAALPGGEGIVRVQASRDGAGAWHLLARPRGLSEGGGEQRTDGGWAAVVCAFPHPGPGPFPGCKVTSRLPFARARDVARAAGADEALLFDAGGQLVEGARSNVLVVGGDGALVTPPLARGAVAGVARELVLERVAGVQERDVGEPELRAAAEIFAVNAVRGAVPVTRLDGRPVGPARASRWPDELERALARD